MANDPRSQALRDRAAASKPAKASSRRGVWIGLLVVGVIVAIAGGMLVGAPLICIAAAGLKGGKKAKRAESRPDSAARRQSPRPRDAACTNPEPHRHFEVSQPSRRAYKKPKNLEDDFAKPIQRWPTPQERRLENMRHLYEAGLLTREEYNHEVGRIKSVV